MARCARAKFDTAIYHIILRSISDVLLFKDTEDKEKFLYYLSKYKVQFNYKIYAYCLMSNHIHIILDGNGADISKIMHSINQSYAQYFNRKYNRHGHLFQNRFKSKIVTNERYIMALSVYIHNNPTDISGYYNNPEEYEYSSLGIYFGIKKDKYKILDKYFILQLFGRNNREALKRYKKFIHSNKEILDIDSLTIKHYNSKIQRTIINRNKCPEDILNIVAKYMKVDKSTINLKYNRDSIKLKSMFVFLCRNLCNTTYSEISNIIKNLSEPYLSKLSSIAYDLICKDNTYKNILNQIYSTAI